MDRRVIVGVVAILLCASVAWGRMGLMTLGGGATTAAAGNTFTDNFSRATIGSNWTTPTGGDPLSIYLSEYVSGTVALGSSYGFWNTVTFSNNQYSEITPKSGEAFGDNFGPAVRMTSANRSCYYAFRSGSSLYIRYVQSDGSYTNLANWSSTLGNNATLRIEANGTTISVYNNGSFVGSTTHSTLTSGSPGIVQYNTDSNVDSWGGGDL